MVSSTDETSLDSFNTKSWYTDKSNGTWSWLRLDISITNDEEDSFFAYSTDSANSHIPMSFSTGIHSDVSTFSWVTANPQSVDETEIQDTAQETCLRAISSQRSINETGIECEDVPDGINAAAKSREREEPTLLRAEILQPIIEETRIEYRDVPDGIDNIVASREEHGDEDESPLLRAESSQPIIEETGIECDYLADVVNDIATPREEDSDREEPSHFSSEKLHPVIEETRIECEDVPDGINDIATSHEDSDKEEPPPLRAEKSQPIIDETGIEHDDVYIKSFCSFGSHEHHSASQQVLCQQTDLGEVNLEPTIDEDRIEYGDVPNKNRQTLEFMKDDEKLDNEESSRPSETSNLLQSIGTNATSVPKRKSQLVLAKPRIMSISRLLLRKSDKSRRETKSSLPSSSTNDKSYSNTAIECTASHETGVLEIAMKPSGNYSMALGNSKSSGQPLALTKPESMLTENETKLEKEVRQAISSERINAEGDDTPEFRSSVTTSNGPKRKRGKTVSRVFRGLTSRRGRIFSRSKRANQSVRPLEVKRENSVYSFDVSKVGIDGSLSAEPMELVAKEKAVTNVPSFSPAKSMKKVDKGSEAFEDDEGAMSSGQEAAIDGQICCDLSSEMHHLLSALSPKEAEDDECTTLTADKTSSPTFDGMSSTGNNAVKKARNMTADMPKVFSALSATIVNIGSTLKDTVMDSRINEEPLTVPQEIAETVERETLPQTAMPSLDGTSCGVNRMKSPSESVTNTTIGVAPSKAQKMLSAISTLFGYANRLMSTIVPKSDDSVFDSLCGVIPSSNDPSLLETSESHEVTLKCNNSMSQKTSIKTSETTMDSLLPEQVDPSDGDNTPGITAAQDLRAITNNDYTRNATTFDEERSREAPLGGGDSFGRSFKARGRELPPLAPNSTVRGASTPTKSSTTGGKNISSLQSFDRRLRRVASLRIGPPSRTSSTKARDDELPPLSQTAIVRAVASEEQSEASSESQIIHPPIKKKPSVLCYSGSESAPDAESVFKSFSAGSEMNAAEVIGAPSMDVSGDIAGSRSETSEAKSQATVESLVIHPPISNKKESMPSATSHLCRRCLNGTIKTSTLCNDSRNTHVEGGSNTQDSVSGGSVSSRESSKAKMKREHVKSGSNTGGSVSSRESSKAKIRRKLRAIDAVRKG